MLDVTSRMLDLLLLTAAAAATTYITQLGAVLCRALCSLLMHERVYVYKDGVGFAATLAAMDTLQEHHWYAERWQLVEGIMRPAGLIVGRRMAFFAHVHSDAGTTVRVYSWRWLTSVFAGSTVQPAGHIQVLRNISSNVSYPDMRSFDEMAFAAGVPPEAVSAATSMADRIVAHARGNAQAAGMPFGCQARVLLCGRPGVGKSTCARVVADKLGAALVTDFDPSCPGLRINTLLRNGYLKSARCPLVVVIEEVDVCLRRLGDAAAAAEARSAAHGATAEVTDKASWNNMMDMLQFQPNMVLILTSNLTHAELDAIDAQHQHALLREGRVTGRFDMDATLTQDRPNTPPLRRPSLEVGIGAKGKEQEGVRSRKHAVACPGAAP